MSQNPDAFTVENTDNKCAIDMNGIGYMQFRRGGLKGSSDLAIIISSTAPFGGNIGPGEALIRLGTAGLNGAIYVLDDAGRQVFHFDAKNAVLDIGAKKNEGDIRVYNDAGEVAIHLDGGAGDIKLLGADCAENFDVDESQEPEPGTVMIIGDAGKLHQCAEAYDKRVAGIISGAGGYKPGIVLDKQNEGNGKKPIALSGKVYCKADARFAAIEVGDLLTTSTTFGHAMKATDPLKAFGAVIGKALQPLKSGRGLVPVIVALQ